MFENINMLESFSMGNVAQGYAKQFQNWASDSEELMKAMTTGDGVVATGDTGGKALRVQFLHNVLETASYNQDHAALMKRIPKEKIYSNTFEYTVFTQYGGPGDITVPETGTDGAFGVGAVDDNFVRRVAKVKYMAAVRQISLAAQDVNNIEPAIKVAQTGAINEIIGKSNMLGYYGDSNYAATQFDGLARQIWDWVISNPGDQDCMYDAGGQPLTKDLLQDVKAKSLLKYGDASALFMGVQTHADLIKTLFPEGRYMEGAAGAIGTSRKVFASDYGNVDLIPDPLLRPNRPLMADGTGVTGKPKTSADTGSYAIGSSSGAAIAAAGASPGTDPWYQNVSLGGGGAYTTSARQTGGSALPALPTGEGNQSNHLANVAYRYAVSVVYNGKESLPWEHNATAAGINGTSNAAVTPTAGQVVTIAFTANATIGGNATVSDPQNYKVRVYRTTATGTTVAADWNLLAEAGIPSGTLASLKLVVDNGAFMPGTADAFMVTESKNGAKGWMMAQLTPLMRREGLPEYIMGSPLAMLWFAMPVLLVPKHHIWIRNIGRVNS